MKRAYTFLAFLLVACVAAFSQQTARTTGEDSPSGTWTRGANQDRLPAAAGSTLLSDGRWLVSGGVGADRQLAASIEIFDPAANVWSDTGAMAFPRAAHTATLLPDGRVLVAGGRGSHGATFFAEVLDPASGLDQGVNLIFPRQSHAAAVLADGRVLLVGGTDGSQVLSSSEIYDPATGSLTLGPDLVIPRQNASATTLLDGTVLIAGGNNGREDLASAELYDPVAGRFTLLPAQLSTARSGHVAALLPHNNAVIIVGGSSEGALLDSAELYMPWTGAFTTTGPLLEARSGATGFPLMAEGRFLVLGGSSGSRKLHSTEVYHFATLTTDKPDYAAGETVTIGGAGWQPGESVTLTMTAPGQRNFTVAAEADSSGRISAQLHPDYQAGATGTILATGSQSQAQAPVSARNTSITTLTSSGSPSPFGQYVTFTATVDSVRGGPAPSGSVAFTIDSTAVATIALAKCGSKDVCARFSINSLATGTHNVQAAYSGDKTYQPSSGSIVQTVSKSASSTSVTSSSNPVAFGVPVTFTASVAPVAPAGGVPTGTVTFYDGTTSIGSATLGDGGWTTLTISTLTLGTHSIKAEYAGDSNFSGSTSATLSQTVGQTGTTLALVSSQNPSPFGAPVTFTATLSSDGGAGSATGKITFSEGITTLAVVDIVSGGTASFTTSSLAAGPHSITASYSGDSNFGACTATILQSIGGAATTVTVTSSANPVPYAQPVTFTAVVNSAGGAANATGTITFKDGSQVLATVAVNDGGWATFSTDSLSAGTHSITASYSGDSNFAASTSDVLTQTVSPSNTTTTVSSSAPTSSYGQAVTFTATVKGTGQQAGPASPLTPQPAGTVTFYDGAVALGTGTLTNGWTTLNVSTLSAGTHTITAVYSGSAAFNGSTSAPLIQNVTGGDTSLAVVSSTNPVIYGQMVTFTAVLNAAVGAGNATGTITFKDGGTALATVNVNDGGWATFYTDLLTVGTHSITASYSGDSNFAPATSSVLTQTVIGSNTITVLASSSPTSTYGQAVTLTATVSGTTQQTSPLSPLTPMPGGTVTFYDGNVVLGTGTLTSWAWTTLNISTLAVGTHSLTAVYNGSGGYIGSTSAVLVQTVNAAPTTVAVISSANPIAFGQMVTFTAVLNSPNGAASATGTITFKDGGVVVGTAAVNSGGWATFNTDTLTMGTHSITASYGGSTNFAASTSTVYTQTITAGATIAPLSSSPPTP